MKRALLTLPALLLCLAALGGCALDSNDRDARTAAVEWLALLDAGNFQKAYADRPPRILAANEKDRFVGFMQARRAPLGRPKSREFFRVTYSHTLNGAPDGNYGFIIFKSSFEHKAHCMEYVTVTGETGHWLVSGYSLR